jgi:O-antigen ligase
MPVLHTIREAIATRNILPITFLLFLTGFFFFPGPNLHKLFFYVAVLAPFLLTLNRCDIKQLFSSRLAILCLLYWLYSFLTITWSTQTDAADVGKLLLRLTNTACFFGIVLHLVGKEPDYDRRLLEWLCWIAAGSAIFSILYFYSTHPFPQVRLKNCCHLHHAILGASAYGLVAVICFYRFIFEPDRNWRWLYLLVFSILLADMLLTKSRGPLLALVAALGTGEMARNNYTLIVLLALSAIGYILLVHFDVIQLNDFFTRNNLFSYRLEIWRLTWEKILTAPWFGHGINSDETVLLSVGEYAHHPHNAYLASLLYGGLVGGLLLLAICLASLAEGVKQARSQHRGVYLAMLVFGLVCMLTEGHQLISNPRPLWLFFWFPIALLAAKELTSRMHLPPRRLSEHSDRREGETG